MEPYNLYPGLLRLLHPVTLFPKYSITFLKDSIVLIRHLQINGTDKISIIRWLACLFTSFLLDLRTPGFVSSVIDSTSRQCSSLVAVLLCTQLSMGSTAWWKAMMSMGSSGCRSRSTSSLCCLWRSVCARWLTLPSRYPKVILHYPIYIIIFC